MIRSIEKLKVRIDQNLNRAEKSEALSEDVVKVENKVTSLKQVFHLDSNIRKNMHFLHLKIEMERSDHQISDQSI